MLYSSSSIVNLINRIAPMDIVRRQLRHATAFILSGILLFGLVAMPVSARADIDNHVYVHYLSNHTPAPIGTLTDVTNSIQSDGDGHVHDLYGNLLVFNTDSTVSNSSSQTVGYVYH